MDQEIQAFVNYIENCGDRFSLVLCLLICQNSAVFYGVCPLCAHLVTLMSTFCQDEIETTGSKTFDFKELTLHAGESNRPSSFVCLRVCKSLFPLLTSKIIKY